MSEMEQPYVFLLLACLGCFVFCTLWVSACRRLDSMREDRDWWVSHCRDINEDRRKFREQMMADLLEAAKRNAIELPPRPSIPQQSTERDGT